MVVCQLSVDSVLFDVHGRLNEVSFVCLGWTLIEGLEFRNDEGVLVELVSESFLCLVGRSDLLEEAWCLFFDRRETLHVLSSEWWNLVLCLDFTVEIPDEDAVSLADTDDLVVVSGVEDDGAQGICVSDEALEEEWHGLLSLVIPDLEHVIFTTGEHVVGIQADVET